MESYLIISNYASEILREFCDVQARTLFFHTLCSDLDYFSVLIPEKPDEDSVNIHVTATVTACVTGVIILGVIIAYKRFCTCKSNRFKKNRVSDSSSNLRLPPPELINSVGEKNNSGEMYQLHDKTPDVIVRQKSIS